MTTTISNDGDNIIQREKRKTKTSTKRKGCGTTWPIPIEDNVLRTHTPTREGARTTNSCQTENIQKAIVIGLELSWLQSNAKPNSFALSLHCVRLRVRLFCFHAVSDYIELGHLTVKQSQSFLFHMFFLHLFFCFSRRRLESLFGRQSIVNVCKSDRLNRKSGRP